MQTDHSYGRTLNSHWLLRHQQGRAGDFGRLKDAWKRKRREAETFIQEDTEEGFMERYALVLFVHQLRKLRCEKKRLVILFNAPH